MTDTLLYRTNGPVEIAPDGLTVTGLAAPYGEITTADDGTGPYLETFDPGAFTHVVSTWPARKMKVQLEHPDRPGRGEWVGRGHGWQDDPDGLRVVLRLDDTPAGHAAAFKIRDGQTPAMSVAFRPGRSRRLMHPDLGEVTHRQTVRAIGHVALVPEGAYPGALVEALRAAVDDDPGPDTPRRDQLSEALAYYASFSVLG